MLSDHYRGGITERLTVIVVTVDPSTNRIEVVGKDAAIIQVEIGGTGLLTWPLEGEVWTIIRENGRWMLEGRVSRSNDNKQPTDLNPGESLLPSNTIWTPSGEYLIRSGDTAGGVLSGTYPNPGFAVDMATQAELDTLANTLTPFVRIHRTAQAVTAAAWNIVQWDTIVEEQNLDGYLTLVDSAPHHVLVETAGVYHVETDTNWSVGTNDHLVFIGVNTSAQPIVAGAAAKEAIQQRVGPLANTALSVASGPLLLNVGDKIHVQVFQTTAQNMATGNLRIARIGN